MIWYVQSYEKGWDEGKSQGLAACDNEGRANGKIACERGDDFLYAYTNDRIQQGI
jgi:hypothetical protein